jgi:hypothetical protein
MRNLVRLTDRAAATWTWACRCLFVIGLLLPAGLFAASFDATLDRDSVAVGESATLSLRFEDGSPEAIPTPPNQPNLRISNEGTSRSMNIVNGQISSSFSQNFGLTPLKAGDYIIPALQARIDGRVYTSKPVTLRAVAAGGGTNTLAFMRIVLPKTEAFVGEALTIECQAFIREGVANAENILQGFDAFTTSPLKADGFTVIKVAHGPHRRARVGNANFFLATIVTSVMPVKTGPQTIGSFEPDLVLQLPSTQRSRAFGMFPSYQEQRITLTSEPQMINILPLPRDQAPAQFSGAIGSYTLATSAGPTNVAVGDPVTLRIQISGKGALDNLALPALDLQNFKTYPPTSKTDTTDQLGLEGQRVFEQVIVPQRADVTEIPAVTFSYFDSDQKAYRTLNAPAIPLVVRPSSVFAAPSLNLTNAPGSGGEPPPSRDIVHIKPRPGQLRAVSPPLIAQPWFLAVQTVPAVLWIAALLQRRRAEALANNPRLRRRRHVEKTTREGLAQLRAQATGDQSEAFFATVFRLLQEQLGERLDMSAASITESVIDEKLAPSGVPQPLLSTLHELFQACNLARYALTRDQQELTALIPRLETTLRDLQQLEL